MVYLLVIFSSSVCEYFFGSIYTPPFAPPKGTVAMASLKVMSEARAIVSYKSMPGAYRVPPFTGKK